MSSVGSVFKGTRDEYQNIVLKVASGSLPDNISGVVYFQSQCGNVNSGGLPFPKKLPDGSDNPDYGSPNLNGDGMVYKVDFNTPGSAMFSCKLVKTPSYYADLATSIDGAATKAGEYTEFKFRNFGISRISILLGPTNPANTALIPVKYDNDSDVALLATYDVGRPIKIDPDSLDYITPLGKIEEYNSAFPPLMQTPLPMFETTAHPSYDPVTKELYITNFTKSTETELTKSKLYTLLYHDSDSVLSKLYKLAKEFEEKKKKAKNLKELEEAKEEAIEGIKDFINSVEHPSEKKKKKGFFKKILDGILKILGKVLQKGMETEDHVFLYTFDNKGPLKCNRLVDEKGKDIVIFQCMHQTSLSENYVLLMDSSFKFAFDLLINNPFPEHPVIDRFIRMISTKQVLPYTDLWLVDRNTLRNAKDKQTVLARKVPGGIPAECVHFSTEYDETDGKITLFTAQNNAACLAEWVRPYDTNYFTGKAPDDSIVGDYAVGELSISSIGKYVVDPVSATVVDSKQIKEIGNLPEPDNLPDGLLKDVGPNTWGIGLYTFRDMISPTEPNRKIDTLFFVNFGTNPDLLTKYIYELYKNFPNRDPENLETLLAYTEKGIPGSILTIDAETMTITDHYEVDDKTFPVSLQFVPCKTPTPGRDPSVDGYIFVTVKVFEEVFEVGEYHSQLWLFEAWNVGGGPVCQLASDKLNYCSPLHTLYLPEAPSITSGYQVDVIEDYKNSIHKSTLFFEKKKYKKFFEKYVYPNFKSS